MKPGEVIVELLGGFNKLQAALSARRFRYTKTGVMFHFDGSSKANIVIVDIVKGSYKLRFFKMNLLKTITKQVGELDEIAPDDLKFEFENFIGVYLDL